MIDIDEEDEDYGVAEQLESHFTLITFQFPSMAIMLHYRMHSQHRNMIMLFLSITIYVIR